MRRAALASAALAFGLALSGCSHVRLPYLPGDRAFETPEVSDIGGDHRIDPVQTGRPVAAGARPPCKFGGKRCPPWERAWPANHGVVPADKVTDAGVVKRQGPAS